MKHEKTARADLLNRRKLFFEIGFIVSLAAAIIVFSAGQTESTMKEVAQKIIPPPAVSPPLPTKSETPKAKVKPLAYNAAIINLRRDADIIPGQWEFPDAEDIAIDIPKSVEESVVDDLPTWIAEEMPIFLGGGLDNFRGWILSQIIYPAVAIRNGIHAQVHVQFVIEKDGSLTSINVIYASDRTLAEETMRVLQMSPLWTPGRQRGKPARVCLAMQIDYCIGH